MNKNYVLYNLREAHEEMARIIDELERATDYDHEDFVIAMSHLYHHINTAWNAQNASDQEVKDCVEENFNRWRLFPALEDLLLVD